MPPMIWNRKKSHFPKDMAVTPKTAIDGHQFTLKGSPRHYDDVKAIIESTGEAQVYFGEPLAYERGAGIALWRVRAKGFTWLPKLYDWWTEMERTEPIAFTFHLYLPADTKYPVMDLRQHSAQQVAEFIVANAPVATGSPYTGRTKAGWSAGKRIPDW